MPIPPYIKNTNKKDLEKYQNVYAKNLGSCAAPTAGFHFTNNLLQNLKLKGVNIVYITLHVGLGTFKPIQVDEVEKHKMDKEYYVVSKNTADTLNKTRQNKNKIFAVGTTVVRTLESVYDNGFNEVSGFTDIYIYPGYKFKAIDCFITNFHLPKSTPLMMLAGFINNEIQDKIKSKNILLDLYKEAIKKEYLFYSFGEAMLII
jgi:S-adenosylmethionine:tRNA ribosyltransferase-isomerase